MLAAVEFDDDPPLAADEIGEIPADRFLADEFKPVELAVAQPAPQHPLGPGHRAAQRKRSVKAPSQAAAR
jgi:hypothetical protein